VSVRGAADASEVGGQAVRRQTPSRPYARNNRVEGIHQNAEMAKSPPATIPDPTGRGERTGDRLSTANDDRINHGPDG